MYMKLDFNRIIDHIISYKELYACIFSGIGVVILVAFFKKIKLFISNITKVLLCNKALSQSDIAKLNDIASVFTGNAVHYFIDTLESSRSVYIKQIEIFDSAINRLSAPDKKLKNKKIEKAKSDFFNALGEFIKFTSIKFNSINGVTARFYGGISEYEIIRYHNEDFEKDENQYLNLARKFAKKWEEFQYVVRDVVPDYIWR